MRGCFSNKVAKTATRGTIGTSLSKIFISSKLVMTDSLHNEGFRGRDLLIPKIVGLVVGRVIRKKY